MRDIDGLVGSRLYLVAIWDIFQVRVILVAGGGAQEYDAEEYKSR